MVRQEPVKANSWLSFLSQLSDHGPQVVPVAAADADVGVATNLLQCLISQLPDSLKLKRGVKRILNELEEIKSLSFLTASVTRGDPDPRPESNAQYEQVGWFREKSNKFPSQLKEAVFVLCVDEFQNLKNPEHSLCSYLHRGNLGLNIVPVYFGLSDAPDVLRNAGVTRSLSKNLLQVGSLLPEDAIGILQTFFNVLKIMFTSEADRDTVAADVSTQCDCWPLHLVSWMRAACEVLPANGFLLNAETLQTTNEICTQHRREYYSDRVRGAYALSSPSGSEAFGNLLHDHVVLDEDEINLALSLSLEKVKRKFDIERFIAEAIHLGVLERVELGQYRVPIPSLADYIYEVSRSST